MPEPSVPVPWVDIDPEAPLLAFFTETGEKLVEFRTKQDFDEWAGAVQTLTELQAWLKGARRELLGAATSFHIEDRAAMQAAEIRHAELAIIETVLGRLETKRSGTS